MVIAVAWLSGRPKLTKPYSLMLNILAPVEEAMCKDGQPARLSISNLAEGLEVPMPTLPYWPTINSIAPVVEDTCKAFTPATPAIDKRAAGLDVPMPTVAEPVLAMNNGVRVGVVLVPTWKLP